jgi:hypothetical protein
MSKSTLADLRAKAAKSPPSYATRILPNVCLDQEVVAKVQQLETEKLTLLSQDRGRKDEDGRPAAETKMAQGPDPRLAEIDTEIEDLWDSVRPQTGDILLRAIDGGEWFRWKDANPPREGNESDELLTFGLCNATALASDLGRYVAGWNDEELGPDDWATWLGQRVGPADQGAAVRIVVEMHETRLNVPKPPSGSSVTVPDETA